MPANLRELFLHLQGQLEARLQTSRSVIPHAGAMGGASRIGLKEDGLSTLDGTRV